MVAFAGRVEAKATVPTGGAAVSATIVNGGAAATITVPAAAYYLTAAGGVSSILTTLQTQLNNNSQGYPQTATALGNAIGWGTWTTGAAWLCNESSGSLAAVFGSPTLTAVGTPTYGTAGPRGGIDYAIGFNSSTDAFSGGDVYDVTATSDLLIAFVAKASGNVSGDMIGKWSGAPGWFTRIEGTSLGYRIGGNDGSSGFTFSTGNLLAGEWVAGLAYLDRGAVQGGIIIKGLTSGTVASGTGSISGLGNFSNAANLTIGDHGIFNGTNAPNIAYAAIVSAVGAAASVHTNRTTAVANWAAAVNAAWAVSMSTSTGLVSIGWTGYSTPTWSLSWTSTDLRDLFGFVANISAVTTTQTSTKQAKGLWLTDSPLNCDDHPSMAPEDTDLRGSESPDGLVLGLSGNKKYIHTNVRYQRVPVDRIRETSATYANASLEVFFRDCITGLGGHSWFTPLSKMQVYWSNAGTDTLLGTDYSSNSTAGVSGWSLTSVAKFRDIAKPSQEGYVGQFDVTFPRLVSNG